MSGKVVVSQLGARMHYAVANIFASQGRLAHFYTDICATKSWPRLLTRLPVTILPAPLKRLVGRRTGAIPTQLVTSFPAFGIRSVLRHMNAADAAAETCHAIWAGSSLSKMVARRGFHGATGLYAYSGDALEQMMAAKRLGLWTAVEQMIAPRNVVERLLEQERQRFPDWCTPSSNNPYATAFAEREKAEWSIADIIICPSEFVRQHVIAEGGAPERCVLVPYGVDQLIQFEREVRLRGPLRVLTVGEVGLRKGSPYVVEAARLLGVTASVRLIGCTRIPRAISDSISQWVELKGAVPRAQMAEEFRWADIFLLPSICEGSATAVYEALAAGLPVVTTENTGSVVRHGVEGFIVPVCDPHAIAMAVGELAANDGLRTLMSANALRRASDYTVAAYGKRLLSALPPASVSRPPYPPVPPYSQFKQPLTNRSV